MRVRPLGVSASGGHWLHGLAEPLRLLESSEFYQVLLGASAQHGAASTMTCLLVWKRQSMYNVGERSFLPYVHFV